ncbi:NADP-dependent oxidoreductase [Terrabacter sp. MAHUQ-38]|uniref:NADP-dependent oxidoreductase n=1 Tax=unclassified Terrabacter TaxID=2630222 RepID=UPI00165D3ECC|nr:NADP-dependent oxidoreductase [Terrabacter sp. MAHUQ-38]MBC9820665.1 NADP-dependent oxidoreductase [Terrabacter sp. MAHUQ-38]
MRAVVVNEFHATPTVEEIEVPEPAEGEVRVRVHAAAVNGFDVGELHGFLTGWFEHRFPLVLGKDFAGTVDAVGPGVSDLAEGDRVFGVVTKDYLGDGSFADYVTVPTSVGVARLPDDVDFLHGAALGLAGAAALACIDAADPAQGRTILVVGATGGVGNQVVQLASQAGAHVIATGSSEAEQQLVRRLGAAEVVDYHADVPAAVLAAHPGGVDVAIHLAGDAAALVPVLRQGGTLVSTLVFTTEGFPAAPDVFVPIAANPTPEILHRLAGNHTSGLTSLTIQRTYSLAETPVALTDFASGTLGKLVVDLDGDRVADRPPTPEP